VEANFFHIGGHSLLATQVLSRVREVFGVEVALRRLFGEPTVAGLARSIEEGLRAGEVTLVPPLVAVPREEEMVLSFAQQRLWFIDQLQAGNNAYNMAAAVRLTGELDVTALEQSFSEIIRRHEVLRTSFKMSNGRPVQVIAEARPVSLDVLDLSHLDEEERESEARRLAAEEARRSFDLSSGPLLRVSLLRLSEEEYGLLFTMHHIISDGWSMGILVKEAATLYEAFSTGKPSPLEELSIQYADYAHWQREWLQGEVLEEQLSYWREQLAGAPPLLKLPTDYQRPANPTWRGGAHPFLLPLDLSRSLEQFNRHEGVTLFMTLLAAWQSLLAHYSGQRDIVVGTDIANRNYRETEKLIGFFVNQLVLRTDLTGDPGFRELLRRVREVTLGAYAHQDVPFDKLVEALNPDRALSRTPLFQTKLTLENTPQEESKPEGLTFSGIGGDTTMAKLDLMLNVKQTPQGVGGWIEYDADLFEPATIARMERLFTALLSSVLAQPEIKLSELEEVLAEEERQQQLREKQEVHQASLQKLGQIRRKALSI
jgi:hypothetical protein